MSSAHARAPLIDGDLSIDGVRQLSEGPPPDDTGIINYNMNVYENRYMTQRKKKQLTYVTIVI